MRSAVQVLRATTRRGRGLAAALAIAALSACVERCGAPTPGTDRARCAARGGAGARRGDATVRAPPAAAPLASAPDRDGHPPSAATTARCPTLVGLEAEALLSLLPEAGYACVEALADALAPRADEAVVARLLEMSAQEPRGWSRRNALRVILRFADRAEGDPARVLIRVVDAPRVTQAALARLREDRCVDVLHDAIYILDACFFPFAAAQPPLEAISAEPGYPAALRLRAIAAIGRLFWARSSLSDADVEFLVRSLASDERWVRAEAASIARNPAADRVSDAQAAVVAAALGDAYAREGDLVPLARLAQALDCYDDTDLYAALRERWEAAHLPHTCSGATASVRSSLPEPSRLLAALEAERDAFFAVLGPPFDAPVPGDANATVTLIVFGSAAEYDDYMDAFVRGGAGAGGLYVEAEGLLYTFDRTASESVFTTAELIQHEYAHALQARYVYPGVWGDPGYAAEPKGWADEGLAELFAGFQLADGGFTAAPRAVHLATVCAAEDRPLADLLAQRAGYDEPGTFDYANAWAFSYFLHTDEGHVRHRLYVALRDARYRCAEFAEIAGVASVGALDEAWRASLRALCEASPPGRELVAPRGRARARSARDAVVRIRSASPDGWLPRRP